MHIFSILVKLFPFIPRTHISLTPQICRKYAFSLGKINIFCRENAYFLHMAITPEKTSICIFDVHFTHFDMHYLLFSQGQSEPSTMTVFEAIWPARSHYYPCSIFSPKPCSCLGRALGLCWGYVGPSGVYVGARFAHLGAMLGLC